MEKAFLFKHMWATLVYDTLIFSTLNIHTLIANTSSGLRNALAKLLALMKYIERKKIPRNYFQFLSEINNNTGGSFTIKIQWIIMYFDFMGFLISI